MRFHVEGDFARTGKTTLPSGDAFVAVGIAPSSDVDLCLVGNHRLGPGMLVPYSTTVSAIRGYRTPTSLDPVGGALALQLYERCDVIVPPGPRGAYHASAFGNAFGVNVATAERVLRVPFQGRRQAVIAVKRADGDTGDAEIHVRGVRYLSRERIAAAPTQQPYFEVVATETLFDGGGAIPTSGLGGGSVATGQLFLVGGDAVPVGADELEVWILGAAVGTGVYVQVEVTGERGW